MQWTEHRVKKGETLSAIAGKYGTSVEAIRDTNGLKRKSMLQVGQTLVIPKAGGSASNPNLANSKPAYMIPSGGVDRAAIERYSARYVAREGAAATRPDGTSKVVHTVRRGDTLGQIAERYHTSPDRLRAWNNLSRRRHIYPGQKLKVYVPEAVQTAEVKESTAPATIVAADESRFEKTKHVVERGENLYSIGKQFNVSTHDLMSWNGLTRSTIRTGDVLVIWTPRSGLDSQNPNPRETNR